MCSGKRALRGTIGRGDMIRNVETKGVGERADGSRWMPSSATQGQAVDGCWQCLPGECAGRGQRGREEANGTRAGRGTTKDV